MNQKEWLSIILKLTCVGMLLTQDVIKFFANYSTTCIINYVNYIINNITLPITDLNVDVVYPNNGNFNCNTNVIDDILVFDQMYTLFQNIFQSYFILKVIGLILGPYFLIGLILIASIIIFFIVMVKAVMIYIMTILGLSIMYAMAPIFLPFILFKKTRTIFDAWLKQIFSFILQPICLFLALGLFIQMYVYMLNIIMLQPFCQAGIIILSFIYYPVSLMSAPNQMSLATFIIPVVFTIFFISYGAFFFINFCVTLASAVLEFSAINFSGNNTGDPATNIYNAIVDFPEDLRENVTNPINEVLGKQAFVNQQTVNRNKMLNQEQKNFQDIVNKYQ
jgi:type IV secretory pathway VirB6-like protein